MGPSFGRATRENEGTGTADALKVCVDRPVLKDARKAAFAGNREKFLRAGGRTA